MKNVIDLEEYKIIKESTKRRVCSSKIKNNKVHTMYHTTETDTLRNCVETFRQYNKDKERLLKSLSKDRAKFKYPTIMSKYRKNTDIFTGLYLFSQEALFKIEENDLEHAWVLSLFANEGYVDALITKIDHDIKLMSAFVECYSDTNHKTINNFLHEIIIKLNSYTHYKTVFSILKDIREII